MKNVLIFTLALVLTFSLSACNGKGATSTPGSSGGNDKPTSTSKPKPTASENAEPEPSKGAASGDQAKVVAVSASKRHSAVITDDGKLWTAGYRELGALGRYDNAGVFKVVMEDVTQVALGDNHTIALKNDGSVWVFGYNLDGQLGTGMSGGQNVFVEDRDSSEPIKVLDNAKFVGAGRELSYAIKTDGSLWMWGYVDGDFVTEPTKVMDDVVTASINSNNSISWWYGVVEKSDGSLWEWGKFNKTTANDAIKIPDVEHVKSFAVLGKWSTTLIVKNDNTLWEYIANKEPVLIAESVAAVSDSYDYPDEKNHRLVVKTDGSLWGSGTNDKQELGIDITGNVSELTQVNTIDSIAAVSTGSKYTLVIKNDGTLWGFGSNDEYMGLDSNAGKLILPTQITLE